MKSEDEWILQLNAVFIEHRMKLRRAAYSILGDWDRADDVIHDVYLRMQASLHSQSRIKQPVAYLIQMVRNMAIDQYRRSMFEMDLFASEDEGLLIPDVVCAPDICLMHSQDLNAVTKALSQLPDRTQKVFELYRIYGYTQLMIAEELNISVALVNNLLHTAIRHCKKMLPS
ncbi:RNA polymerase factor sigma-70 [Nitrosomonas sp. JL21]|uniref:sigma-70 family RNA polymerase sigma factor n=1 Tax=Nitrosomonas sp. JL21 TaxID=153949 RepID=UPI00136C2797|nr:sigma-70 family RNA polymerase sigma factor [Nitrosomonas sp. JL21]MBL8498205.1 sigma-70 family RNA polymerase sigma factor [Nitrosomonas sp.]MCC7090631.1 sigma-70 family RNA polymerase sigma factor [Nitrosomonas sp.]MXS79063.1 RNA polymerase factor sigma-70 [Nitrosomonas sp. JL21]